MAPNRQLVESQTCEIIHFLLQDEDEGTQFRDLQSGACEADGPGDDFDPVVIADKLRSVADALNDDMMFKAALTDLQKAVAQEAVDAAFSSGVQALCKAHVSKGAEVAPEVQLIKASVALGLYIKKSCPDLRSKVQVAMSAFLNTHVASWVTQQGGWDKVADIKE